ncbi:MAG TPA: SDR family NAD(P)-dependent oxidoreductase, partial [Rhodocyclaceae bacterium]|nr:SDR family NAD(P)-dependent oxidoreductase [Rhodocyclaceae bacterium]
NNAGIADTGTLADSQPERIDAMVALNVLALTRLAAAATASFLQRGRGTVVNVASVVALAPEMFNASYSATKAYVLSLSQTLQHEVGQHGVHVQAVLPGITRTEIWERTGLATDQLPASMIMEAGELVDAALAGLDQGETITIPSLPDPADWEAFVAARNRLGPNLSHNHPAARYGLGT